MTKEQARIAELERELAEAPKLWECDGCGFGFDAMHTLADGSYRCPVCREVELERDLAATRQRVAELEATIERDRTKAADILNNVQKALASHEWLRLGRGSYEWDDDRWKDEFGACFDNVQKALNPLAVLAGDLTNCPKTWADIQRARAGLVLGSDPTAPQVAVEREEVEGG